MQGMQQNEESPVFDVKRIRGMSNITILYNLKSIWLLFFIGLDT